MASDRFERTTFAKLISDGALEIGDGYRAKNEELGGDGLMFLRAGHVTDTHIDFDGVERFHVELAPRLRSKLAKPGDAVITTKGNSTGRTTYVSPSMPPFVYSPHLSYWRSLDPNRIEGGFLRYWCKGSEFVDQLAGMKASTDMAPYLSLIDQRRLQITLPPVIEQRAIAHILGALDDKIELNRRMNETLEAMARALFRSWFVGFDPVRAKADGRDPGLPEPLADLFPARLVDSELGKIPEGWEVKVLDDLVDLVLGGDWGEDEPTAEKTMAARCIRGTDIPDLQAGGIGQMPIRYLKPSSLVKRRLTGGDLVVEISGGSPSQSTGRPVLVSDRLLQRVDAPLVCSNFCRLLKPRKPTYSKVIYLWLRALYTDDKFLQFENGTTGIKNLAFSLFSASYRLCIPAEDVLTTFDAQVAPLFARQQAGAAEADSLAVLRDTLLPQLISGELRIATSSAPWPKGAQ